MRKLCGWLCLALCLNLFQVGWVAAASVSPNAAAQAMPVADTPCHEHEAAPAVTTGGCHTLHVCCLGLPGLGTLPTLRWAEPSPQVQHGMARPLRWTVRGDRLFKPPKDTLAS